MKNRILKYITIIFLLSISVLSCVEPYSPKTDVYENILVVKAELTNILEKQKVTLSRANRLEIDTLLTETNAIVFIKDELNNIYSFTESNELGVYLSNEEFKAIPNTAYTLHISTVGGEEFESRAEYLTPSTQITNLYAEMLMTNEGVTGVQIYVDSEKEDLGDAGYIRYEFEETFKVVTPNSINKTMEIGEIIFLNYCRHYKTTFTTHIPPKPNVCYTSLSQTKILQINIKENTVDAVLNFPIRFIPPEELHMLKEKYSIIVKQYSQSKDAYSFYKILDRLSSQESLLSEYQMGFVQGNMFPKKINDKVVGFFDVTSIATKRIFFNFESLDMDEPPYFFPCTYWTLNYRDCRKERPLIEYYGVDVVPPWDVITFQLLEGYPYKAPIITFVNPECGDCSKFSNPLKPDFWED